MLVDMLGLSLLGLLIGEAAKYCSVSCLLGPASLLLCPSDFVDLLGLTRPGKCDLLCSLFMYSLSRISEDRVPEDIGVKVEVASLFLLLIVIARFADVLSNPFGPPAPSSPLVTLLGGV